MEFALLDQVYSVRSASMLSYLYQLIHGFRQDHGILPNILYVNRHQYLQLTRDLPVFRTHDALCGFLALDVHVAADVAHPHVAWVRSAARRTAAG